MNKETYTISELKIENFKCIDSIIFNFDNNNLIVFDGPNGYGKTTAFDAIETIFSKTPRKYREVNLSASYAYSNSPIHKDKNKPINLSLTLKNGTDEIVIKRTFAPAKSGKSRDNNIHQVFIHSKLFINDREIDSSELNTKLNFPNIENLFNVLNYVEQDENTFFLKKDPKKRYTGLTSLLGIENEKKQLDNLSSFSKKLKNLISKYEKERDKIKSENKKLLSEKTVKTEYFKLLDKKFGWDLEDVRVLSLENRNSIFKEIELISYLIKHKEELKKVLFLNRINKYNNEFFLDELIKYYWSFKNIEELEVEVKSRIDFEKTLIENSKILDDIKKLNFQNLVSETYLNKFNQIDSLKNNIEEYQVIIKLIISLRDSLGIQAKILEDLKDKRKALIKIKNEHNQYINLKGSECPTCGYDWKASDKLTKQIQSTEEQIFKEYNASNIRLESEKKKLENKFLNKIVIFLKTESEEANQKATNLTSITSYNELVENKLKKENRFEDFLNLFSEENKNIITSSINRKIIDNSIKVKENIVKIVEESTPQISEGIKADKVINALDAYFDNKLENIESLSLELIENKKKYIEYQYYNSINNTLKIILDKIDRHQTLSETTNKLISKFDKHIKNYTKNIIENISLPFYIYTGKILQEHSLGTGLMFDLDVSKSDPQINIRPANRDQEVSYTLSSGQLSATVISLMLVLNKVYNKSKLGTILIDDPLQTLDEINTHSLIEVLKHNFSNQQIILSTHEDRYSKFMRYKYEKFKLSHKNIKMKDL